MSQEPFAIVFALLYTCDAWYRLLFCWNLESSIHVFKRYRNLQLNVVFELDWRYSIFVHADSIYGANMHHKQDENLLINSVRCLLLLFMILLPFNAPDCWVFAAHPTSILPYLTRAENLELTINILLTYCRQVVQHCKRGSSSNSYNRHSSWDLSTDWTGRSCLVLIGFYNTDWTHCQPLFPRSGFIPVYASYWTSPSASLGSVYLLLTVCNLVFSYFRIFKGVFCACCHLPKDLSVFFCGLGKLFLKFAFKTAFRSLGVW